MSFNSGSDGKGSGAAALGARLRELVLFGLLSGAGLAIDMCVFLALVAGGVTPMIANLVSASLAVSFVYFTSIYRVFRYSGHFLMALFLAYLGYQLVAVVAASWAVAALATFFGNAALAKIAILPITFSSNFLFMKWLTSARRGETATPKGNEAS